MNALEEFKRKNELASEDILAATRPIAKQLQEEITKNNVAAVMWEKQEKELTVTVCKYRDREGVDAKNEESRGYLHSCLGTFSGDLQDRLKIALENLRKSEDSNKFHAEEVKDVKLRIKSLQTEVESKDSQIKFQTKLNDLLREQNEKWVFTARTKYFILFVFLLFELTRTLLFRLLAEKTEEIKNLRIQLEEAQKAKAEESHSERPRNINELYKDRNKLKLLVSW